MRTPFHRGHTKAAKLTREQVYEIRTLYMDGISQGKLAVRYRMSIGQIGRIVRGESWGQFYNPATETAYREPQIPVTAAEQRRIDESLARVFATGVTAEPTTDEELQRRREPQERLEREVASKVKQQRAIDEFMEPKAPKADDK